MTIFGPESTFPSDWIMLLALSPIVGSLLGVLVLRLPRGEAIAIARSRCESCARVLRARDLVPLLSYLARRGKCGYCGEAIGWFHPAIEIAAMLVVLWAATVDDGARLIAGCVLGWSLLALGVCDWRNLRLPDALTLPLIVLGLLMTWWLWPEWPTDHAMAAALGYLGFRALAWAYRRWRGRDGLGQGDAKLLAAAGAWLGLAALPDVILIAGIAGLAVAAISWLRGGPVTARTMLPFGPCMALSTWLLWLYA